MTSSACTRIFDTAPTAARDRLRDARTLESALARPGNYAVYEDANIAMQAATLAHGIAQSQSFLDGNKRTPLIATTTFLALNRWDVNMPNPRLAQLILDFAARTSSDLLAVELRAALSPRP